MPAKIKKPYNKTKKEEQLNGLEKQGTPLFENKPISKIKTMDRTATEILCQKFGNGKQLFESKITIDQPIPASAVWVNRLKDALEKTEEKTTFILLTENDRNTKHRLAGLKTIGSMGLKGVCVLAKEGHKTFSSNLNDTNKLDWVRFVDCVTGTQPITFQPDPATIFIANKDNFTELSLAIDAAISLLSQNAKFIWMDGVEELLVNHHPDKVARFSEFLIRNNETKGIKTLFACVCGEDEKTTELKELIEPLVDQTIQIP